MRLTRFAQLAPFALIGLLALASDASAQRPSHGSDSHSRGSSGGGSSGGSSSGGGSSHVGGGGGGSSAPSRPSAPPPASTGGDRGASRGSATPPPQRIDPTPSRGESSRDGRPSAPNMGNSGASESGRPVRYTPPPVRTGSTETDPTGTRGRANTPPATSPTDRLGPASDRERAAARGNGEGETTRGEGEATIPVIRTERRNTFPALTNPVPPRSNVVEHDRDSLSARRRDASDAARRQPSEDTLRRAPSREIELPAARVDRESILERYKNAREDAQRGARGVHSDGGPSQRIKNAREDRSAKLSAAQAALEKRIHNAREDAKWDAKNDPKRIKNARDLALERAHDLRGLAYRYPDRARRYELAGAAATNGSSVATKCGVGWGVWWATGFPWFCCDDCFPWWGPCGASNFGWVWWWNGCHPWSSWCWWNHPCAFGCSWFWGWQPWSYSYWSYYPDDYYAPTYYSTVIEHYYETPAQSAQAAPAANADTAPAVGEATLAETRARAKTSTSDQALLDSLLTPGSNAAAAHDAAEDFLSLGDNAFGERRYGDAVHFYAKAVEFEPTNGTYYMILADALFAAGDYHYAAYALRKALELDPTIATKPFDKHEIYKNDRTEFDRQLAVLELYLKDQPTDVDARLVLAANDLFGGRPAAAVDLLDLPASAKVRDETAGKLIYEAAKLLQYGKPAAAPTADGK